MLRPSTAVLSTVAFILSPAAFAQCLEVQSDLSDIGVIALGANMTEYPFDPPRFEGCPPDNAPGFDCNFEDPNGIRYVAFEGYVVEITRILENFDPGTAPLGLVRTDSLQDVVNKIRGLLEVSNIWLPLPSDHPAVITTGLCFMNELGLTFGLELRFDENNRLKSYTASTEQWV